MDIVVGSLFVEQMPGALDLRFAKANIFGFDGIGSRSGVFSSI